MSPARAVLASLAAALAAASLNAEPRLLVLDPAASRVSFTLPATGHDVEGTLALRTGRITFDLATGAAAGEIAVDLTSAATGNRSRDKTMHDSVLESGAYPLAVFRAERLRGSVAPTGTSHVTLDGKLSLHGAEHAVSLPAIVQANGDHLEVTASFPVPYVAWGLHDPSLLFLRVAGVVSVKVVAEGTLAPASEAAARME